MHIRTLDASDASPYQALRLRGLKEHPEAFASSFEEEVATPLSEIVARLAAKDHGATFGAFVDQALVALVSVQRERMKKLSHKAFIWGVYVAPEARGQGVGAALLAEALEHATSRLVVRQVNLGVNTRNAAALALYRKLGFTEYGLERAYLLVNGELHDEYQMCWLAPAAGPGKASAN